ncbi:hypothetical protein SAMN06269301_3510 [Geobacter sp. DSM 9736]|nr:hypothetical protein SAMN06269301_3510 [Geobacter sp. DSM 9736]
MYCLYSQVQTMKGVSSMNRKRFKIVLTEEEALALESDQKKWPKNWTILSRRKNNQKILR